LCFVIVLFVLFDIVGHGGHRGDAMRALVQWRHPVASSEALVVLRRSMCPASHCCIHMVVDIEVNLPAFFATSISLLATIIDK
jgi:hypothetical protein